MHIGYVNKTIKTHPDDLIDIRIEENKFLRSKHAVVWLIRLRKFIEVNPHFGSMYWIRKSKDKVNTNVHSSSRCSGVLTDGNGDAKPANPMQVGQPSAK
uniref:Uncharacterized protein n=1 Tax=Romanomermis culicivorax TaxID=13658 RepID=A0A915KYT7_ROMCU